MTRPNIRIWAILALLFLATGSGAGPPRGDVFLPYPSAFSAVAASAANAEPRAAPVAQSGKTGKLPKAVAPANEEEEDEADADGESEAENDSTEPAGPSAAKGLSKDPKVAPAKDAEQSATGPAAAAPPASVPPAEGGANKDHDHPENPLDRIQPESAPDFSAVDFSKLVELRESLHAQVDAEKQRLDGDTAMTPEERLHRMEQLDMKVKEIEVLEGMVRRALEVYQNVLRTSKERNTTASDIKAESEKIIYDLQLTALKAKADMKAMAKDEIHREKEKEKAKDSELAAAAAAAAGGSGVGSDKAGSAGAIGTEKDKSSGGKNAGMSKEPDDMPGQHDSAPDKDGDVGDGKGAKSTGAAPSNGTQPATNGTDSAGKVAQNIAQDIAKDILKEVSGTADKIEDNLLESNAFAEGAKAKGATIETVLKVEDTEKEKFDEEREEASIPLFRPFAKGRGGIVSILIDAESNQYVLSRPNDVTYFYEDVRLLNDVVIIFIVSFFLSFLCHFLRIPLFFGHLSAGVVLGPSAWNLIRNLVQIHTLAQLGVAFILFVLGVEFNFSKLRKIWRVALFGSLTLLCITCACFIGIGRVLGSKFNEAMVVGASVFLSSTAVVVRFLPTEEYETAYGRAILGILVMQDILLGILLALLPAFEKSGFEVVEVCFRIFGSLALFIFVAFVVAWFPAHFALRILKDSGSKELYLLGCVALCMIMMQLSAHLGISMEIGCFIAGLIISSKRSLGEYTIGVIEPVRDMFGCLFFAAIGLHGVHPSFLIREVFLLLLLTSGVVVFKFTLAVLVLVMFFRYPWRTASIVSIGLSQISEFVFVLASRAKGSSIISREVYYLLLGTTSLSMMIAPVLWTFLGPRGSARPRFAMPREHKSPPPSVHVIDLQRLRSPSLLSEEGGRNRHPGVGNGGLDE